MERLTLQAKYLYSACYTDYAYSYYGTDHFTHIFDVEGQIKLSSETDD